MLLGKRFPLKMKGKVKCCCIKPAIPYGSKILSFKENEKEILRKTESYDNSHVQSDSCRQTTQAQVGMLELKKNVDWLATLNAG